MNSVLELDTLRQHGIRMQPYFDANRDLWDRWAELHVGSRFYDVEAFRRGSTTLNAIELDHIGDVRGKRMLHLQCHFGLDTLSWARLGAEVTGVDFSARAIALAAELARETGLDATFIQSNVYDLANRWNGEFDIVYTSYGVLPWLPDLHRWAAIIAASLKPGGSLYLVEFHPFATMLGDDGASIEHPYFPTATPVRYDVSGSYADTTSELQHESYEWAHSSSELIAAVRDAGMQLSAFDEYPYSPYGCFPFLEEAEPGKWRVRGQRVDVPLTFLLEAVKPADATP